MSIFAHAHDHCTFKEIVVADKEQYRIEAVQKVCAIAIHK
jgi:hypothetical protein